MNSENPIVSCVIPTYENLDLASRAILSAVEQDGVAVEVIVTDDSKSDRVSNFVDAISPHYPLLRYQRGPRNGNPVANWNVGLNSAAGTYCVLLHHDEFFLRKNHLARVAAELEKSGAKAVVVRPEVFGMAGRGSRANALRKWTLRARPPLWTIWLTNWLGSTACVTFRREGAPRFDEGLVACVDIEFYTRLLNGKDWRMLPDVAIGSLVHGDQISSNIDLIATAREEVLELRKNCALGLTKWRWDIIAKVWNIRAGLMRK